MKKLILVVAMMLVGCTDPVPAFARAIGFNISNVESLKETKALGAIGFSYYPSSLADLTNILAENNGEMLPIIEVGRYFWDAETGTYISRDVKALKEAIGRHHVVLYVNEPMWNIRMECDKGKATACAEIAANYANTKKVFSNAKMQLGTYQLMHIEAFAELIEQKKSNSNVLLLSSADYVGFNCYGPIDNCHGHSQWEYGNWVYDAMKAHQRMILVAGAFPFEGMNQQLIDYFNIFYDHPNLVAMLGIFTYDDVMGIPGAKHDPSTLNLISSLIKLD